MTFRIEPVPFDDPRAVALRDLLDDELDLRYAALTTDEDPALTAARTAALALHPAEIVGTWLALDDDGTPVGHVLLRRLGEEWELKRLVVPASARRRGVGRALTKAVLAAARAGGARRVILQTGAPQPESITLYRSMGFTPIPVYEPYRETMPNSLCFACTLDAAGGRERAG